MDEISYRVSIITLVMILLFYWVAIFSIHPENEKPKFLLPKFVSYTKCVTYDCVDHCFVDNVYYHKIDGYPNDKNVLESCCFLKHG